MGDGALGVTRRCPVVRTPVTQSRVPQHTTAQAHTLTRHAHYKLVKVRLTLIVNCDSSSRRSRGIGTIIERAQQRPVRRLLRLRRLGGGRGVRRNGLRRDESHVVEVVLKIARAPPGAWRPTDGYGNRRWSGSAPAPEWLEAHGTPALLRREPRLLARRDRPPQRAVPVSGTLHKHLHGRERGVTKLQQHRQGSTFRGPARAGAPLMGHP